MIGQIWRLHVSDGMMDAIHGGHRAIEELYVPDLKLTVNEAGFFLVESKERYGPHKGETVPPGLPDPVHLREVKISADNEALLRAMVAGRIAYETLRSDLPNLE